MEQIPAQHLRIILDKMLGYVIVFYFSITRAVHVQNTGCPSPKIKRYVSNFTFKPNNIIFPPRKYYNKINKDIILGK